jgi:methionyl-tRNA synthetase
VCSSDLGTSEAILGFLGTAEKTFIDLRKLGGVSKIGETHLLFSRLEDDHIEEMRGRFSGSQKERAVPVSLKDKFRANVLLKTAKITAIERHPKADKLYIETVDAGGENRTIVSGLVPFYKEEELLGKTMILVANLQPAKLRGTESQGMLLAGEEAGTVEVIFVEDAEPGTRIVLSGDDPAKLTLPPEMTIDTFFETPLTIKDSVLHLEDTPLSCNGRPIRMAKVVNGKVR